MLLDECRAAHVDLRVGQRVTEISRADRFASRHNRAALRGACVGDRDRRPFDSQNRRDRICLRGRAALRSRHGRAAPRIGGSKGRGRDSRDVQRADRSLGRRRRLVRSYQLSREHSFHSSRFVGPCDSCKFRLTGKMAMHSPSTLRRPSMSRIFGTIANARVPKSELKTVLAEILPSRLAEAIAIREGDLPNLSRDGEPSRPPAARDLAHRLKGWEARPITSEGWAKAEVTVGGIDTAALSSKTMDVPQSRVSSSSARQSTSPDGWAATTSNGHGRADGLPGSPSSTRHGIVTAVFSLSILPR